MNNEIAMELKNISKTFSTIGTGKAQGRSAALSDVSLALRAGETYGFVGLNGAGKTTAIKTAMGLVQPNSGSVRFFGAVPCNESFRRIGFAPEKPGFYELLTGSEIVDFSAKLLDVKLSKERKREILEKVGLYDDRQKRVGAYSKGMQQRLGIACAMMHDPDLYILDEPSSGLDPLGRKLMKAVLQDLKKAGKTIFFSTHIIADVMDLCDRIAVIHKGKILFEGSLQEFNSEDSDGEECFVKLIENSKKELDNTKAVS
jgi:ABC-2 type transport system ATP-binding protein